MNKFAHVAKPLIDLDQTISLPICDDCDQPTDWKHAVQMDPWGREIGEVFCENCAEKRYDRYMEKLMEET